MNKHDHSKLPRVQDCSSGSESTNLINLGSLVQVQPVLPKPKIIHKHVCNVCGSEFFGRKSKTFCSRKCARFNYRKSERPNADILKSEIEKYSWVDLGKKYGVTDNAVKKWARQYKLEIPKRRKIESL